MMRICLTIALSYFSLGLSFSAVQRPYAIERHDFKDHQTFRLYNRATGKTIWTQAAVGYGVINWSNDGKALALDIQANSDRDQIIEIHFWRKGYKQVVFKRKLSEQFDYDYVVRNFIWSPDDKKVLFRLGSSGAGLDNVGTLFCYDVEHQKLIKYTSHDSIYQMKWKNNHLVYCWTKMFTQIRKGNDFSGYYTISRRPYRWKI